MNFARILIKHTDWNKNKLLRKLVCKEVSKRSIDIIKSKLKENISKCEVNIQRLTSEIKESTRNTNSTSNNIDDELSKLIIELKDTQNALEKSKRSLEVFQIYKKDLQYIIKNFVPNLLTIFEKEVPNGKPSLKTELLNLLKDIDSFTYKKSKKHTAESITASFNRFSNHLYDTFSTSIVNDVIYGSVINDESE